MRYTEPAERAEEVFAIKKEMRQRAWNVWFGLNSANQELKEKRRGGNGGETGFVKYLIFFSTFFFFCCGRRGILTWIQTGSASETGDSVGSGGRGGLLFFLGDGVHLARIVLVDVQGGRRNAVGRRAGRRCGRRAGLDNNNRRCRRRFVFVIQFFHVAEVLIAIGTFLDGHGRQLFQQRVVAVVRIFPYFFRCSVFSSLISVPTKTKKKDIPIRLLSLLSRPSQDVISYSGSFIALHIKRDPPRKNPS